MPKRFARQFGMWQQIPNLSFHYSHELHRADGRNTVREAFILTYNEWRNNRFNHLVEDEMEPLPPNYVGDGCVENYINWFYFYGRRFIRNPAHHLEIGVDGSAGSLAIAVNALRRVRDSVLDAPAHEIQQVAAKALVNIDRAKTCRELKPCRG
ncbi:unnamed protein product [Cuscuta campestris]|uniref:Uncharacterized protein n=1 Tax=Cuscuta campestris TaxID=132261 RepID=A0A484M7I9_9ASTE|nr:unnamed protein product [Cuscuta campestris]